MPAQVEAGPALAADAGVQDAVFALPDPSVAGPALAADAGVQDAVFALPAQAVAGPALVADARVQDWSQLAPAVNQDLSSAEMRIGNSIVSKLDSILKDPTDHRPGKKRCLNHMDLQLIIDSSGSIGRSEFSRGKRAMKVSFHHDNKSV